MCSPARIYYLKSFQVMVPFHTKVQLPVFNWKKLSPSNFSADTALVLKSNVVLALFSQVFPQCVHFGGWSVLSLPFPTSRKCESVCVLGYFYQPFQCTTIFNLFSCQSVTGKLWWQFKRANLAPSPVTQQWKVKAFAFTVVQSCAFS